MEFTPIGPLSEMFLNNQDEKIVNMEKVPEEKRYLKIKIVYINVPSIKFLIADSESLDQNTLRYPISYLYHN